MRPSPMRSFDPHRVGGLECRAWVEAGSDPANPMLAQERALLVRSYAALLAAVHSLARAAASRGS